MPNWDKVKDTVSRTADKAAVKAGEVGENVKLRYKLHQAKGELSETYEKLGRLTYDQLHFGHDRALEINQLLPTVGKLRDRIRRLSAAVAREDNAVYCATCGTRLAPDMAYCPGCGKPQPQAQTAEADAAVPADEV